MFGFRIKQSSAPRCHIDLALTAYGRPFVIVLPFLLYVYSQSNSAGSAGDAGSALSIEDTAPSIDTRSVVLRTRISCEKGLIVYGTHLKPSIRCFPTMRLFSMKGLIKQISTILVSCLGQAIRFERSPITFGIPHHNEYHISRNAG
jgi:hypothetical protein